MVSKFGCRRNFFGPRGVILGSPRYPEDLPRAEPILPGHTLLRPSKGMLRSAIKFPLRDIGGNLVYGNRDNLGITYGKTPHRIRYTDFRKANPKMPQKIMVINLQRKKPGSLIVIEIIPSRPRNNISRGQIALKSVLLRQDIGEDNSASEVFDDLDELYGNREEYFGSDFRRRRKRSKLRSRHRHRDKHNNSERKRKRRSDSSRSSTSSDDTDFGESSDSDTDTGSSSIEKNPGNPYTIHKNKYKQNWIWNHEMDGDHMNVNPYAPGLNSVGPSSADLFFARKWWYFNQDDYKPMA